MPHLPVGVTIERTTPEAGHPAQEEERRCLAKRRYPTRAAAEAKLRLLKATRPQDRMVEVYACPYRCGGFHLGHPQPRRR